MYANDTEYTEGSLTNVDAYINDIIVGGSEENPEGPEEPIRPTGVIEFTNPNWVGDGTATVEITTDNQTDELQYQINGIDDDKWTTIESGEIINGLKHNDNVYGRLWNGEEESEPASVSIKDVTPPEVEVTTSNLTSNSVTLTVTASDEESGLATSGRYTYYLGNTQIVSNNTASYTYGGLTPETQYTLRVVVKDNVGKTAERTTTITTPADPNKIENILREGNYVYYQDGTGITRKCVVLYGPENANYSSYGIQIITMDTVEDITLGGNNFAIAMESYNNAVVTLNTRANAYNNGTYSISARSVGSVPDNPYSEAGMCIMNFNGNYNGKLRDGDNNYITDSRQMKSLNIGDIRNIGKAYWYSSRSVDKFDSNTIFYIKSVTSEGENLSEEEYICGELNTGETYFESYTHGLRPVFTLRPGLKVTGGLGTEASPYTIGL